MKVYKKLGLVFVLWRMRFLNIRQVICKIASRWDLKSRDFSNLHFVGKMGQTIKYLKNRNFGTTQVINIKLESLKSYKKKKRKKRRKKERKKKDLCKYLTSTTDFQNHFGLPTQTEHPTMAT